MNSGFYITELAKDQNIKYKPNTNLNDSNDSDNLIENVISNLRSSKEDQITLEKSKHNVLDYLIREETNFADLYKVENYFKNILNEKSKKYDVNDAIIKKKLKEIKNIEDLINSEIISNIELDKDDIITVYADEKIKLENKIENLEYDNECYQYTNNRIIKANVKLNKFDEIKLF